jgi:hypothetical protein
MVAVALVAAGPAPAFAQNIDYTMTGGSISGLLNGNPFTNATWSLSSSLNPSNQTSGTDVASGNPYRRVALSGGPTLTLTHTGGTQTVTLTNPDWAILSWLDLDSFGPGNNTSAFGFGWGAISAAAGGGLVDFGESFYIDFATLSVPIAFTTNMSFFQQGSYNVNGGNGVLEITGDSFGPGAFCAGVSPSDCLVTGLRSGGPTTVPEPATLTLLAVGGAAMLARRRRMTTVLG